MTEGLVDTVWFREMVTGTTYLSIRRTVYGSPGQVEAACW
jgi:hypothetical protein